MLLTILLSLPLHLLPLQVDSDVESVSTVSTVSTERKRRKTADSDVTTVLTGAAKSLDKLVSGVTSQRRRVESTCNSEPQNDDWYFAMRMYHKLRAIPDSRDKEMFKVHVDTELINMSYGSQSVHAQDPVPMQPTYHNLRPRCPQQSTGGSYEFQVPFTPQVKPIPRGQMAAPGYLSQVVGLLNQPEDLLRNDYA